MQSLLNGDAAAAVEQLRQLPALRAHAPLLDTLAQQTQNISATADALASGRYLEALKTAGQPGQPLAGIPGLGQVSQQVEQGTALVSTLAGKLLDPNGELNLPRSLEHFINAYPELSDDIEPLQTLAQRLQQATDGDAISQILARAIDDD